MNTPEFNLMKRIARTGQLDLSNRQGAVIESLKTQGLVVFERVGKRYCVEPTGAGYKAMEESL